MLMQFVSLQRSTRCQVLVCLIAGCLTLSLTSNAAYAGGCGCESSCDSCDCCPPPQRGCDCLMGRLRACDCLSRMREAVSGGLKRFFCLEKYDRCGCDTACDACDGAMLNEMMPAPSSSYHHHAPVQPTPHMEQLPSPPMEIQQPIPQRSQMRMTEPRLQSPDAQPAPNQGDRESLFEELSDPFTDDEAQVYRRRRVRPSSYQQPISRSRSSSSRRNYSTAGREFKSLR